MANEEHLEILLKGVDVWNDWKDLFPEVERDLRGANLRLTTLPEVNFGGTDLRGADLSGANLTDADFLGADLTEANLCAANLSWSVLRGTQLIGSAIDAADLSGARLSGANLSGASLRHTNLSGADLSRANVEGTDFEAARASSTRFTALDLSGALGLETIIHNGPSSVGIDTVYKSRGKIPEAFLRGCGVPEDFVRYIGSMVGRPIEFYSCFISYSTKDQEFADRLYADLQNKGVRCWFAPHDIKGGEKIHEQIDRAIRLHDKLLLILSEHSMNSNWVKTEIANAREREQRETKQMLFPITLAPFAEVERWKLFDADRGIDSAREIREYFIPDFSNWEDHDWYQKAFQRLVMDLKAEAGK